MELEYTSRFLKLKSKIRNQRSIKDTDKVLDVLTTTPNLFEIHKILDVKHRAVDDTYRIRYSNKLEMRIIFEIKEIVKPTEKRQILELLWIGSREDYEKYSHAAIKEGIDENFNIILTEEQFRKLSNLLKEDMTDDIESTDNSNETSDFTPQKFATLVTALNIVNPDIAIAQSLLETGHFKSEIFKNNNNLFGMKHPKVRKTFSTGTKNGHASYSSWKDSVRDYKIWQHSMKFDQLSREEYFEKLDKIYCPPPDCLNNNYSNNVKKLLSKSREILSGSKLKPKTIKEHSYMGKYEGDSIKVSEFSKRKLPKPVLKNVLKSISNKIESDVKQSKLIKGEYDDVEIRLFGQLLSYLNGTY